MKAVMISIQPKWVEKIANGQKTIEVRKTRPKIDTPFKCYIYCTKDKYDVTTMGADKPIIWHGKVIGHFVCDRITDISVSVRNCNEDYNHVYHNDECKGSCLTWKELQEYGKGKTLYGWHISDLVIYEQPKELSEFWAYNAELNKLFNEGEDYCAWGRCETESGCTNDCDTENILNCYQCWADWNGWCHRLTRPPQSWQFVEEKEKENGTN